jgi:hypothetical protein
MPGSRRKPGFQLLEVMDRPKAIVFEILLCKGTASQAAEKLTFEQELKGTGFIAKPE